MVYSVNVVCMDSSFVWRRFLCPCSSSSSADGESSLQEHPGEREGDADLLYLHGEEQQEPLGPERRRRQTSGLTSSPLQQQQLRPQPTAATHKTRTTAATTKSTSPSQTPQHGLVLSSQDVKPERRRAGMNSRSPDVSEVKTVDDQDSLRGLRPRPALTVYMYKQNAMYDIAALR